MNLILFVMAAIGLTNIMVDSVVMDKPRQWFASKKDNWFCDKINKILECYQCAGFWCGLFCGAIALWMPWLHWLLYGFAGSFVAVLAAHIFTYFEAVAVVNLPDEENDAN